MFIFIAVLITFVVCLIGGYFLFKKAFASFVSAIIQKFRR